MALGDANQAQQTQAEQLVTEGERFWSQSDKTVNSALKAMEYIEKALNLNPLNYRAWADKGFLLKQLGDLDAALLCLDRSIKLNKNFVTPWYNKGVILGLRGRFNEAVECYNEALRIDPNHSFAKRDREVLLKMVKKA